MSRHVPQTANDHAAGSQQARRNTVIEDAIRSGAVTLLGVMQAEFSQGEDIAYPLGIKIHVWSLISSFMIYALRYTATYRNLFLCCRWDDKSVVVREQSPSVRSQPGGFGPSANYSQAIL